jgi:hypothetical protein
MILVVLLLMAAPLLDVSRYRAYASRRACIRSRSFLDGCALPRLHSQPLMIASD